MAENTQRHEHAQGGPVRHPLHHRALIGLYGVILVITGLFTSEARRRRPPGSTSTSSPASA